MDEMRGGAHNVVLYDDEDGEEEVWTMEPAGAWDSARSGSRFARLWPLLSMVWLPALIPAVTALLHAHPAPARLSAILAGLALFVAVYLWAAAHNDLGRAAHSPSQRMARLLWRWSPIAVMAALSIAIILGDGPRWLALCIYTSACAAARLPLRQAVATTAGLMVLTVALGWLTHDPWSDLALAPFWVGMTGLFVILLIRLTLTNRALQLARDEVARLAVEAERLRFARDLHDLLGHDLARIALQSEVVEALVPTAPERAIATAREMGEAARTALQEVRAAVAGYRQPTLASELRGAAEILAAAGIAYRHDGDAISLPPATEAVLAWTVREGVTNTVKHSRARHCTVRVTREGGSARVEVSDDGSGASRDAALFADDGRGGHGLTGLGERVAALGGHLEAGPRPGGGFRLAVTLPVETDGALESAEATPDLPVLQA